MLEMHCNVNLVVVAYVFRTWACIQCGAYCTQLCWLGDVLQHTPWSLCECRGVHDAGSGRYAECGMCNSAGSPVPIMYLAIGSDTSGYLTNTSYECSSEQNVEFGMF